MTLIVCGDAHIGSGADYRLADQAASWRRVCIAAVHAHADVIGTGDFFHLRRPRPEHFEAFQQGLAILREGGRSFLSVVGNHEIAQGAEVSCLEVACAGYDAHAFRSPVVIETSDGPVGFLPWAPLIADARTTASALLVVAQTLRDQGARMLIAHHALSGGCLPTGLPVLELGEPILDSHALAAIGFELVLSGHIHRQQVIVDEPMVAHVGPLCRGNFGERDVWTGAWQVTGPSFDAHTIDVPDRAFVWIAADARHEPDATEHVVGVIHDIDLIDAVARVTVEVTADQALDLAEIREALLDDGAYATDRVEANVERVRSTRHESVNEHLEPTQSFDTWLEPQRDTVHPDTFDRVRETAHAWIGESSS